MVSGIILLIIFIPQQKPSSATGFWWRKQVVLANVCNIYKRNSFCSMVETCFSGNWIIHTILACYNESRTHTSSASEPCTSFFICLQLLCAMFFFSLPFLQCFVMHHEKKSSESLAFQVVHCLRDLDLCALCKELLVFAVVITTNE